MTRRRKRELTEDEKRLWHYVVRHVEPLPGRAPPPEPEPATAPAPTVEPTRPPPPGKGETPPPRPATAGPYRPTPPPAPPIAPLTPLARKERLALKRRSRRPDATLDLHGMRQAEAHLALIGFLHRCAADGHTIVLVVTGKGGAPGAGTGSLFDERGVLRRVVPHWLREPDLRPIVVGFETASQHHGGDGALYVRLRRRGGP